MSVKLPSIYLNKLKEMFSPKSHPHEKEDIPEDTVYYTAISQPVQIPDPATQQSGIFYDNVGQ